MQEITYDMLDHSYAFGEDSRFVRGMVEDDVAPDPAFAGDFFSDIDEYLWEQERERYYMEMNNDYPY